MPYPKPLPRKGVNVANEPPVEHRKHSRVKTEVLAAIEREDSPRMVAYATDLSLGGIRFSYLGTGSEFGVDESVRVTISIGSSGASVIAKVVRIQELDTIAHELALSFVEMDAETRELLEEYLREAEESGR